MAKSPDFKLDTRSARRPLAKRREPYWRAIRKGLALGYRRGTKSGSWIAKHYDKTIGRHIQQLGRADDDPHIPADGEAVLTFDQATEAAKGWQRTLQAGKGKPAVPVTVNDAMDDYLKDYKQRSDKATDRMEATINAHIRPALGSMEVANLTRAKIREWHHKIAATPARLRTRKKDKDGKSIPQQFKETDPNDTETTRKRKVSANKVLTILKAALNHALAEGVIQPGEWQQVKPFKGVDAPKIRFLTDAEAKRLVNASAEDLRAMVRAALLTGARYGELANLKAGDFDEEGQTLHIAESKSGKPRHIALTVEGVGFFKDATAGKANTDPIFTRTSGGKWARSHQIRPIKEACDNGQISPAISFHILRHTYASRLARAGVPMQVIAAQLGHSDTRMTERHYSHLAPSYVADVVRASFGTMGITEKSNVQPMKGR